MILFDDLVKLEIDKLSNIPDKGEELADTCGEKGERGEEVEDGIGDGVDGLVTVSEDRRSEGVLGDVR